MEAKTMAQEPGPSFDQPLEMLAACLCLHRLLHGLEGSENGMRVRGLLHGCGLGIVPVGDLGCVFHAKVATDSTPNLPLIP